MIVYHSNYSPQIPPPHPLLALQGIPGLGRGWFAQEPIPAGTILWHEQPLLVAESQEELTQKVQNDLSRYAFLCYHDDAQNNKAASRVQCNHFCSQTNLFLLFENVSMLNHSCQPNASVILSSPNNDVTAHVQTARPIPARQEVTISYTDRALFWPTPTRQDFLWKRWGFHCACERCCGEDVDEMWSVLEQAAAAADSNKPRSRSIDARVGQLQRQAAALVEEHLPYLKEGGRFAADAMYFG